MGSSSLEHDEAAAVVDTGLVLGLGPSGATTGRLSPVKPSPLAFNSHSVEPSLTLGRQATIVEENWEAKRSPSSPQSMASSLSNGAFPAKVKRERDVVGDEERISSRASDEDDDGSAKKKLRLTKEQSALLEERFKEHSTLNPKQKIALAHQLKLRPRQVEVWFQNRRARTKLKQTEVDCEFLKRCCESLTEENRRLQKEVQQLRALKHVPTPLFMQVPTVNMCPSCERTPKTTTTTNGSNPDFTKDSKNVDPYMVSNKSHFYNHFTHSSSAAC